MRRNRSPKKSHSRAASTIQVTGLALEGDGVGRIAAGSYLSGQAAFVPYSLPGEEVRALPLFIKKNHSRWIPVELKTSSPDRITPPCVHHWQLRKERWCGGCDWQHINDHWQPYYKKRLVEETLRRIGGLPDPPVQPTIPSPSAWRYRNKVQVPFGSDGSKVIAGFYSPDSHDIVPFDDCLIQTEASVALVHAVTSFANEVHWAPYNGDLRKGWLRHLLLRLNEKGEVLLTLVTANEAFPMKDRFVNFIRSRFPSVIGIHQNIQRAHTNVILGGRWQAIWGKDRIEERMSGLNIRYSASSFFQVNLRAAEVLFETAVNALDFSEPSTVVDLYCGIGVLTLLAAKRAEHAAGIEVVPSAIDDAKWNAAKNNISNVEFISADLETPFSRSTWAEKLRRSPIQVIVDPPRSGCSSPVLEAILLWKPSRLIYVSCNPATLARDIKLLSPLYRVRSVQPVDLFPQTSHIESVTCLERILK